MWCLDYQCLGYMGSLIEEYKKEVQGQGFGLLWVRIAEGFAPVDGCKFDMFISMLILIHKLRGSSIIVHCQGGMGRADIVACGWLFKMKLMKPDETSSVPACEESRAFCSVFKLVEVIRNGHSVRIIETAEQARFLWTMLCIPPRTCTRLLRHARFLVHKLVVLLNTPMYSGRLLYRFSSHAMAPKLNFSSENNTYQDQNTTESL